MPGGDAVTWWQTVIAAAAALVAAGGALLLARPPTIAPGDILAYGWYKDPRTGKRRPGHCALVVSVPGYTGPIPDSVRRAIADLGRGVYHLGGGGLDDDGIADCSGWLCEVLGIERVQPCEGWGSINTSAMIANAKGSRSIFRRLAKPRDWAAIGVIDCSASHKSEGAVGRRTGALWGARDGEVLRLA